MEMRTVAAFAVAPIAPPLLYWSLFGPVPSLASLPGVLLYGAMWTYPLTIFIGGPAYRLITRYSRLRALHVLVISGLIGAVTWFMMGGGQNGSDLLLGGLLGLSAGAVFWVFRRRPAAEARVAADRAAPGR
jgi:hypothetical protein